MGNSNDINQGFQQGLNTISNTPITTHNWGLITIRLLLVLIMLVVVLLFLKRLAIYHHCDFAESVRFGQSLKQPLDSQYVGGNATKMMANAAVKWSTISYLANNDLKVQVPIKAPWMVFENGEVEKIIKEKINSSETTDYLESRFSNYTFTQFQRHGNSFIKMGYWNR